jgi:hypothetical protein
MLAPVTLCSSLLLLLLLQASAHEDLKRLLGKAQAIDELESTIPSFIERLMPRNYPAFVHVLRVGLDVLGQFLVLDSAVLLSSAT